MTADRIKEIQSKTAFPDSVSVCQALLQVWNECEQDNKDKKYTEADMLKCWNTAFIDAMNIDSETYKPIIYSDFINSLNKQDLPIIKGSYGCTIETSKNKQD